MLFRSLKLFDNIILNMINLKFKICKSISRLYECEFVYIFKYVQLKKKFLKKRQPQVLVVDKFEILQVSYTTRMSNE